MRRLRKHLHRVLGCAAVTAALCLPSACNLDFAERELPRDVLDQDLADTAPDADADTAPDAPDSADTDAPDSADTDAPDDASDTPGCGCVDGLDCCTVGDELRCVDLATDASHCGQCGTTCALDQRCLDGQCCERASCTDDDLLCGSHTDFCGATRACGVCPESTPVCGVGADGACGAPAAFRVPDTATVFCIGETAGVCPRPGEPLYGQDGHHRRFLPLHVIDAATATLVDRVTGLEWTAGSVDPVEAEAAAAVCANLDAMSPWRLPSLFELLTLADYGQGASVFGHVVGMLELQVLTTATTAGGRIALDTASGDTAAVAQGSVVCVRGATPARAWVQIDATWIQDDGLGLMWTTLLRGPALWRDALAQCDALGVGGFDGWRLPNAQELAALLVLDASGGQLDPALGIEASVLWSATPDGPGSDGTLAGSDVRVLDFAAVELARTDPAAQALPYLCVRHLEAP